MQCKGAPVSQAFANAATALTGRRYSSLVAKGMRSNLGEECENVTYWLGLTRVDGLGIRGAHKLVERFGSAAAVYGAPAAELESCGLAGHVARAISSQAGLKEAELQMEAAAKLQYQIVTYESDAYPPLVSVEKTLAVMRRWGKC